MITEMLARCEDRLRPALVRLPPAVAVRVYSWGRPRFLGALCRRPPPPWRPPEAAARTLWGLRFRAPLGNAAGMFKNGRGYAVAAAQGAGFYLAGTTTARPRTGNRHAGVTLPFAPYPRSGAASNWLGLPNDGHAAVAARLARLEKVPGCPVGASLIALDEPDGGDPLAGLVEGLERFERAGVDFLEINESCPNTEQGRPQDTDLHRRLGVVAERFLKRRSRPLPVLVKLSCDTELEQVPALVDLLAELGFDGVNFGNTSTDYGALRARIAPPERRLFDHFTRCFEGGVSGRPLKGRSVALVRAAMARLEERPPPRELHVVRTGGVEDAGDLAESAAAGAVLSGWYTGYFEAFARCGHGLYEEVLGGSSRAGRLEEIGP